MRTVKVFFSHSTQDFGWVESIVAQVNAMGLRGYVYEHDPQPGRPVAPKIKSAITRSQIFVVFLTLNSHESPYVQQEIGYAQDKGKLVVPFVERGVPERSLAMLQGIERIIFDPQHLQDAINQLSAALSRYALELVGALADLGDFDDFADLADLADVPTTPWSGAQPAPLESEYEQGRQFTSPLLTMTVSGKLTVDRELALALIELALLAALIGVVAYAVTHHPEQ